MLVPGLWVRAGGLGVCIPCEARYKERRNWSVIAPTEEALTCKYVVDGCGKG